MQPTTTARQVGGTQQSLPLKRQPPTGNRHTFDKSTKFLQATTNKQLANNNRSNRQLDRFKDKAPISERLNSAISPQISYNTNVSKRLTRAWKKISKVVTTLQNSRAQEWTWSGAGFTRQTPSQKQLAAPKRSLVYKRARYYHPQLGQFISRDPLGYVDGMSQYRAYFVPGATDPWGLNLNDPPYFNHGRLSGDIPKGVNPFWEKAEIERRIVQAKASLGDRNACLLYTSDAADE